MITLGEQIGNVLCLMPDGSTGAPCGACREFMPGTYKVIEIIFDCKTAHTAKLDGLLPTFVTETVSVTKVA